MENSVFIARVFGICYLVLGAGLALNRKAFQRIMDDFSKNAALLFFAGLFALVVGVVIILTHNVWVANWTVMITIIGWLGFLKGVWLIVFPNTVSRTMQAYQKNENLIVIHSMGALILGIVLTSLGFFAG